MLVEEWEYQSFSIFEERGTGGGLALLWDKSCNVQLRSHNIFHVDTLIMLGGVSWRFTGIYGHLVRLLRHQTWSLLRQIDDLRSVPWVVMGDFNEILDASEKWGGRHQPVSGMNDFQEAIDQCALTDMGFSGSPFTWEWTRNEVVVLKERLDRGLANDLWRHIFSNFRLHHIDSSSSDHSLLLLNLVNHLTHWQNSFLCINEWGYKAGCRAVVDIC